MKKFFLLAVGVALVSPALSFADNHGGAMGMRHGSYGQAGCGLGSMVFESNSKTSQVFAATTNGTFGSQTFGISSGTSNCSSDGVAKIEKEKEMFVAMNFESLSQEMAQGKGETLAAYANLMGCPDSEVTHFSRFAQKNYASSFGNANTPSELLSAVDTAVAADERLSSSCKVKG